MAIVAQGIRSRARPALSQGKGGSTPVSAGVADSAEAFDLPLHRTHRRPHAGRFRDLRGPQDPLIIPDKDEVPGSNAAEPTDCCRRHNARLVGLRSVS